VVTVSTYASDLGIFGGGDSGTGFFIAGGYIVTCYHVIENAHVFIDVKLHDDPANGYTNQVYHAYVVAKDPAQDLALLALDNGWQGPALPIGNAKALHVGRPVDIFGHPGGGPLTLTSGQYLGWDKREVVTTYGELHGMLSLDCYAAPGNSGSPVFGSGGNVVGVLESARGTNGSSWSYAVPINDLTYLGVSGVNG